METSYLIIGARESERLVRDDVDRVELVRRIGGAVGPRRVLAYCAMDTHAHVVVEAAAARARAAGTRAVLAYVQWFNARHGRTGGLLRGPIEALVARTPRELARQIECVHNNPVKTRTPIVTEGIFFEWSSARAFAGLSRALVPNVERALILLGKERRWAIRSGPPLADVEPAEFPTFGVEILLAAAAQTFSVAVVELTGTGRAPEVVAARAVYVALGRLEGFDQAHLAAPLRRTQARVSQIEAGPVDRVGVKIARTLLRVPELRARLQTPGREAKAPRQTHARHK